MTQDEIIEMARQAGFKMENSAAIQAAEIFYKLVAAKALAQPHETTLKEFNQQIHDDPNYHIWVKEREDVFKPEFDALQVLANDNQRMAKIIAELDAKRTWVGLAVKDQLTAKYMQDAPNGIQAVIDYIESKLKELNT